MHIPDGILPAAVNAAGFATAGALTWVALRQIDRQEDPQAEIPKAALLTATFFVASWIHIPVPPTSVHLVLNGLLGVLLGWYAVPAILIGLFFQAVMFGHGGLTTLGVNTTVMALPALVAFGLFALRHRLRLERPAWLGVFAFIGGAAGLGLAALAAFTLLIATIPGTMDVAAEQAAIYGLTLAHLPLMIVEGLFAALVVLFLHRVKPALIR
ncbi:MAG: cobalt transporter CbiM [Anaerolineae bacterium]|nr:cobalt transporter CbiM [Anaerolineae bacterium]